MKEKTVTKKMIYGWLRDAKCVMIAESYGWDAGETEIIIMKIKRIIRNSPAHGLPLNRCIK